MICIKIDDRDQVLHQWDTGQRLVLRGVPGGAKVDFYHEGEEPLGRETYEEDGTVYADIPDVLLQAESKLYACIRLQDETVRETVNKWFAIVHPRPKPSDYIYTEEEKKTWEELQAQIDELKENGVGGGTADAVQYIAQKLTEDQQMQARRNLGLYGHHEEQITVAEITEVMPGENTLTEMPSWPANVTVEIRDHNDELIASYSCERYSYTHRWSDFSIALYGNGDMAVGYDSALPSGAGLNTDMPFALFQGYTGGDVYTVFLLDETLLPSVDTLGIYIVKVTDAVNTETVYDTIPEEYLPEGYGSGGYYTPSVSQPTEDTMQLDFTPSSEDMPTVDPVTVTLPVGPAGEPGDDGLTPYIGENGNWWIGDTDTGVSASASGGVVVQAEEPEDTDVLWIDTDDEDDEAETEETDTGTDKSLGITGAEVGQIIVVEEVGDNGKPLKWKTVEPPDSITIGMELGVIDPVADENNALFTDENGEIFIL